MCGQLFGTAAYLIKHLWTMHGRSLHQCLDCSMFCQSGEKLKWHSIVCPVNPKHQNKNVKGNEKVSAGSVDMNVNSELSGVKPGVAGKKQHVCIACGKVLQSKRDLERHLLTHSGIKPFQCETCKKQFTLKGDLTRHMRIHKDEKPFS